MNRVRCDDGGVYILASDRALDAEVDPDIDLGAPGFWLQPNREMAFISTLTGPEIEFVDVEVLTFQAAPTELYNEWNSKYRHYVYGQFAASGPLQVRTLEQEPILDASAEGGLFTVLVYARVTDDKEQHLVVLWSE